jgi:hypothetical protein
VGNSGILIWEECIVNGFEAINGLNYFQILAGGKRNKRSVDSRGTRIKFPDFGKRKKE